MSDMLLSQLSGFRVDDFKGLNSKRLTSRILGSKGAYHLLTLEERVLEELADVEDEPLVSHTILNYNNLSLSPTTSLPLNQSKAKFGFSFFNRFKSSLNHSKV